MKRETLHQFVSIFIALVWFVNGLTCKVFNLVPRHQEIVESILGFENPRLWTVLIGLGEIAMAIWVLSRYRSRINAYVQMIMVASMNLLEILLVPHLLLWGKMNVFFAFLFIMIVWSNEFYFKKTK